MTAGRNGPFYLSWAINNSGLSWPDSTRLHQIFSTGLPGETPRYHGNTGHQTLPVRSGQMGPGPIIFSLPLPSSFPSFLGVKELRAGLLNQMKRRSWLVHKQYDPPHQSLHPSPVPPPLSQRHPIGCLYHSKNRRSPSLIGHHSLRREGLFPLVSFDRMPTVSHSAATNQVTVPVLELRK